MSSFNPKAYLEPATKALEKQFGIGQSRLPKVAIVLGTGWGDLLKIDEERSMPMGDLPGFESLGELHGHKRLVCYGDVAGKKVIALRGRVHQYEGLYDLRVEEMVRIQVEMFVELGVKTFILTNAAGGLARKACCGDVVMANGFLRLYAPPPPLFPQEWNSADTAVNHEDLRGIVRMSRGEVKGLTLVEGGFAMVRGPNFEGPYDKAVLAQHAVCVGMSTFPEASVLAQHVDKGVRAIALSYITNNDVEEHKHETNVERAKEDADKLRLLLENVIKRLP